MALRPVTNLRSFQYSVTSTETRTSTITSIDAEGHRQTETVTFTVQITQTETGWETVITWVDAPEDPAVATYAKAMIDEAVESALDRGLPPDDAVDYATDRAAGLTFDTRALAELGYDEYVPPVTTSSDDTSVSFINEEELDLGGAGEDNPLREDLLADYQTLLDQGLIPPWAEIDPETARIDQIQVALAYGQFTPSPTWGEDLPRGVTYENGVLTIDPFATPPPPWDEPTGYYGFYGAEGPIRTSRFTWENYLAANGLLPSASGIPGFSMMGPETHYPGASAPRNYYTASPPLYVLELTNPDGSLERQISVPHTVEDADGTTTTVPRVHTQQIGPDGELLAETHPLATNDLPGIDLGFAPGTNVTVTYAADGTAEDVYLTDADGERIPATVTFDEHGNILSLVSPTNGAIIRPEPGLTAEEMRAYGIVGEAGVAAFEAAGGTFDTPEAAEAFFVAAETNAAAAAEAAYQDVIENGGTAEQAELVAAQTERNFILQAYAFAQEAVLDEETLAQIQDTALTGTADVYNAILSGEHTDVELAQMTGLSPAEIAHVRETFAGVDHIDPAAFAEAQERLAGVADPAEAMAILVEVTGLDAEQLALFDGTMASAELMMRSLATSQVDEAYTNYYAGAIERRWQEAQAEGTTWEDFIAQVISEDLLSPTANPMELETLAAFGAIEGLPPEVRATLSESSEAAVTAYNAYAPYIASGALSWDDLTPDLLPEGVELSELIALAEAQEAYAASLAASTEQVITTVVADWQARHDRFTKAYEAYLDDVDDQAGNIAGFIAWAYENIDDAYLIFPGIGPTVGDVLGEAQLDDARATLEAFDEEVDAFIASLDPSTMSWSDLRAADHRFRAIMNTHAEAAGPLADEYVRWMGYARVGSEIVKSLGTVAVAAGVAWATGGVGLGPFLAAVGAGAGTRVVLDFADNPDQFDPVRSAAIGAFDSAMFYATWTASARVYASVLRATGSTFAAGTAAFLTETAIDSGFAVATNLGDPDRIDDQIAISIGTNLLFNTIFGFDYGRRPVASEVFDDRTLRITLADGSNLLMPRWQARVLGIGVGTFDPISVRGGDLPVVRGPGQVGPLSGPERAAAIQARITAAVAAYNNGDFALVERLLTDMDFANALGINLDVGANITRGSSSALTPQDIASLTTFVRRSGMSYRDGRVTFAMTLFVGTDEAGNFSAITGAQNPALGRQITPIMLEEWMHQLQYSSDRPISSLTLEYLEDTGLTWSDSLHELDIIAAFYEWGFPVDDIGTANVSLYPERAAFRDWYINKYGGGQP